MNLLDRKYTRFFGAIEYRSVYLCCIICFCFLLTDYLHAQSSSTSKQTNAPTIIHTPPNSETLGQAGSELLLYISIDSIRDTSRPLRVSLNNDNQFSDILLKNAYLNEEDKPTYELKTYSPLISLSYSFSLINPDGTVTKSQKFLIQRDCLPELKLIDIAHPETTQQAEAIKILSQQATRLDEELRSYQDALKVIHSLKEVLSDK